MKNTKIHKNNKRIIDKYNGKTYDEKVSTIIDMVEDDLPIIEVDYSTVTSILLRPETIDRLESYRLTDGESIENIIMRMILLSKTINTTTD